MSDQESFEPHILGFLCNWCSYAGADLAGVSRFQYPTNLRVIRVMCSGRVDPALVLDALIWGIDGIVILGCHPGDCHYLTGNYYTERRMRTLQTVLDMIGVKPERLIVDWVSASEGERFANLIGDFTEKIVELGPLTDDLPPEELRTRLLAARDALSQQRMRWLVNREKELLEKGDVFGEQVDEAEFHEVKFEALAREYEKNRILHSISDQVLSVQEIAKTTAIPPREVLKNLIAMEQKGLVTVSRIDGVNPKYRRLGGGESL
ncbi:MAG: hydrogenase iron-sulfur subunit [Candidatus Bathyarchaeota archaeon]|nr:MAG: hydrogenase iron-sulfur subunit [Candidatus Bathyarchaeota archaeon]